MKTIVVMTARRFVVNLAYNELDRATGAKGRTKVYGERSYQIQRAQPSQDLPCRVTEPVSQMAKTQLEMFSMVSGLSLACVSRW